MSRKLEILETAMALTRQYGLMGWTPKDVGDEYGCARSLVTYYFGTTDRLRAAVVKQGVAVGDLLIIAEAMFNKYKVRINEETSVRAIQYATSIRTAQALDELSAVDPIQGSP